ncbi:hypothetical protein RhiirB3_448748 [Rhizophagus irregularis]|nr:hypothetical protein RhiirB3_448748 [Rhizophagus irregularis]
MEFGKCKECLKIHKNMDENQNIVRKYRLLEWIPYDKFTNIEFIGKRGLAKVYPAIWIDESIIKKIAHKKRRQYNKGCGVWSLGTLESQYSTKCIYKRRMEVDRFDAAVAAYGEIVNVNEVALTIGDLFNDWESVQVIIDLYAKQNGFVVVKSRKDVDPIDKSII